MRRADVPQLFGLLSELPPHGHRNWHAADANQLDATLSGSRIDPDGGSWSLAFDGESTCGYSLAEPELNINRVVIGCAVSRGHEDLHPALLADAVERARCQAEDTDVEVHIAIRDHEPSYVTDNVARAGFKLVRAIVKMRCPIERVTLSQDEATQTETTTIRRLRLESDTEVRALTHLHNGCFTGSWGFSPNTVSEIEERVKNDHEQTRIPPILVVWAEDWTSPIAYVWTTLHESVGRIEMIGVSPGNRGLGLGRAMFRAGVRHLVNHGATAIDLEVDSQNEAAVSLYRSAGLAVYSRTNFYALRA